MPENTVSDQARVAAETLAQRKIITMGAGLAVTLRPEDHGARVLALTDNSVVNLPKASDAKGMLVEVIAVCADDAAKISISPDTLDAIVGTVTGITGAGAATLVSSAGAPNKDWVMTKTGINKGDYVRLWSDGLLTWYIVDGIGIQASEP